MNALLLASKRAMLAGTAMWASAIVMGGALPDAADIKNQLRAEPVQQEMQQPRFRFMYKDQEISVQPMAAYRISGLVVSHNDPGKWYSFDITHDEKSFNTRDICLIWGDNLKDDSFQRISFRNDDYSCVWRYGKDVTGVNEDQISNNHLITANDEIRARINHLRVGDQVEITGRLVAYNESRWGEGKMRSSSMRRTDRGNGACEIILVEDLKVLASQNWVWGWIREIGFWLFMAGLAVQFADFMKPRKKIRAQRQTINGRWDGSNRP